MKITKDKIITWLTIILTIIFVGFFIYLWRIGVLTDQVKMTQYMQRFGILSVVVFGLIQIIQTIIPLIPGGVTVPAGILLFGMVNGTIINAITIIFGSMINFLLAKKYGWPIIKKMTSEADYQAVRSWFGFGEGGKFAKKLQKLLQKKNLTATVFVCSLLPFLPADLLMYTFGLTKIKTSHMIIILLIAKPINLLIFGAILASPFLFFQ